MNKTHDRRFIGIVGIFVAFAMALSMVMCGVGLAIGNSENSSGVVAITIGADGAIKDVTTGGDNSDSINESDLENLISDLPVRILISYTDSSGITRTDLESLNGASGLIRIDIEVQNTTGALEEVSADINGSSVTQQTLIYTPLTVIGTVELAGVESEQVILANEYDYDGDSSELSESVSSNSSNSSVGGDNPGTVNEDGDAVNGDNDSADSIGGSNGVVSTDRSGTTTVQWASILAPPYLSSSTTFTLVVDADNFQVPDFHIAVQAGYRISNFGDVTGEAGNSNQVELVTETILALSSVGEIFANAGGALDNAYALLSEAGETIGTQTIADLNSAHSSILSQAETLSNTLDSLSVSFDYLMESTSLEIVSELQQATNTVNELLGNPEYLSPDYTVDSLTCEMSVVKDSSAEYSNGVMGVIYDLSARLNAYAEASGNCQNILAEQIAQYIGSSDPSADTCAADDGESTSLSCQLYFAKSKIVDLGGELDADYTAYETITGDLESLEASLTTKLQEVENMLASIDIDQAEISIDEAENKLDELLAKLTNSDDSIFASLNQVNSSVTNELNNISTQLAEVNGTVSKIESYEETMEETRSKICSFNQQNVSIENSRSSEGMGQAASGQTGSAEELLADLQETLECDDFDNIYTTGSPDYTETIQTPLSDELTEKIGSIDSSISTAKSSSTEIANTIGKITELANDYLGESGSIVTSLNKIKESVSETISSNEEVYEKLLEIDEILNSLSSTTETLSDQNDILQTNLSELDLQNESNYERTLGQASETRNALENSSEEFFTDLTEQLTSSAAEIQNNGVWSLTNMQQVVEATNQNLGDETVATLEENSVYVTDKLYDASTDATSVSDLLAEDIQKVLADIGENSLGSGGLLGAIASANGQLLIASANMSESSMQVSSYQDEQRSLLSNYLLSTAVLKASLARLEQGTENNSLGDTVLISSYSYHLVGVGNDE